jgi:hypothetical protein
MRTADSLQNFWRVKDKTRRRHPIRHAALAIAFAGGM